MSKPNLTINDLIDKLTFVMDDLACEAQKNAFSLKEIAEVIEALIKIDASKGQQS